MTELILLRGLDIGLVGFFAFQTSKIQNKKKRPGQCLVFSVEKKTTLTIKNLSYSQNISDTLKGFQVKVQVQVWGFPYFENLIIQDEGVAMLCHSIIANALRISFYRTSKKPITRFALFYLLV